MGALDVAWNVQIYCFVHCIKQVVVIHKNYNSGRFVINDRII